MVAVVCVLPVLGVCCVVGWYLLVVAVCRCLLFVVWPLRAVCCLLDGVCCLVFAAVCGVLCVVVCCAIV